VSVAQGKYGQSALLFDGPPSRFIVNKGCRRRFLASGEIGTTIKRFSPLPPVGSP
jgi:hypothetical protein